MPVDYSKYPPNWKTEIRPRIMARAGNKCEVEGCGFEHKKYVWSAYMPKERKREWFKYYKHAELAGGSDMFQVTVIITIAHLDHDEGNPDVKDDRLMAMCQLHHLRYDTKEKSKRRKLNIDVELLRS